MIVLVSFARNRLYRQLY